jgi:hypothetical protein
MVFRIYSDESMEYDYNPDDALREQVEWAAAVCPVQAIDISRADERTEGRDDGQQRRCREPLRAERPDGHSRRLS